MTTNRRELLIAGVGSAALTKVLGEKVYKELGEQFEDEERKRFGARGFEGVVDGVAGLEANLGIADLAKLTPTA